MIILVTANDRPAQQLLVTKRTTIGAVQALLRLQTAKSSPIEWLIDDGSWAAADPDARLYELASDLRGDGSSFKKAFRVRSVAEGADEQGGATAHAPCAMPRRRGCLRRQKALHLTALHFTNPTQLHHCT